MRGDRLRALREAARLTQLELAERIGGSESMIWRYEQGKREPGISVLARLASFFSVTSDYLIGLTDDPKIAVRDLEPKERAAIDAWRRGEKYEAIKAIVGDE